MIFLDSNVPMYLVGAPHPHKADARHLLESALSAGERIVTDAEVLHEILHRDVAIDRRDAIQPAFDIVQGVVDEVYDVTMPDVERAKAIVLARGALSGRDAIHAAIMEREHIVRIMTFDAAFDELPGIARIGA